MITIRGDGMIVYTVKTIYNNKEYRKQIQTTTELF